MFHSNVIVGSDFIEALQLYLTPRVFILYNPCSMLDVLLFLI